MKQEREGGTSVRLFSDGACSGNPGPGGWASILRHDTSEKRLSGCEPKTTNNRMELMAVIRGLEALTRSCQVRVETDSSYVVKGMTEWMTAWRRSGWKSSSGKPVLNRDLWERLNEASARHRVTWVWIRGHDGHPENEECDKLARGAIRKCLDDPAV